MDFSSDDLDLKNLIKERPMHLHGFFGCLQTPLKELITNKKQN